MKFSVVIPLYNKRNYVEKTIRSVLNQTYQNFEIIVVDDGSTDGSADVVRAINSDKVRLLSQKNQGTAVARNTGIYAAEGEFISLLDADDYWTEEYLQTINTLTEKYPQSDIFVTAYSIDMGNGKMRTSKQLEPEEGCLESFWLTLRGGYDFVWSSVTTLRRDATLKAGCFKPGEMIGQDLDMWSRIAKINPHVAYSSKVCGCYNRMATENARVRVKVASAGAFRQNLVEQLENPERTAEEKDKIQLKYDLKMTAYIYTCILSGEKARATQELKNWKGTKNLRNRLLRTGLRIAKYTPNKLNRWIYSIRLKVF